MLKIRILILILLLLLVQGFSVSNATEKSIEIYVASDREIENFLQKFITNSVNNLTDLVSFVMNLLKSALGSKESWPKLPNMN